MKRKLFPLVCVCLFFSLITKSQHAAPVTLVTDSSVTGTPGENIVFTRVEKDAEFPGGAAAWIKYLQKNLDAGVPVKRKAPAGKYRVVVRFIVSKDGRISGITAETRHGFGMEEEVTRIIQKGPNWIPAVQNGREVNAYRRQPVTFVVSGK